MYFIVEDCSPFYIKFSYAGINNIIKICSTELDKILQQEKYIEQTASFIHWKLPRRTGHGILDSVPFSRQFDFQRDRVSLFISKPGHRQDIHIDGASISFNFSVRITDNKCITNWFNWNDIEQNFNPVSDMPNNRAVLPIDTFLENPVPPIQTMIQEPGICTLFNSDFYHNFDNSQSENNRVILTLRVRLKNKVCFQDAKQILFGAGNTYSISPSL